MTDSKHLGGFIMATKIAGVEGGYTSSQLAAQVGISTATLARWRKAGLVSPKRLEFGKAHYYVYTEMDVDKCRSLRATIHAGRPPNGDNSIRVTKPNRETQLPTVIRRRRIVRKRASTASANQEPENDPRRRGRKTA